MIRPRPDALQGQTYRLTTPAGTAFITINCAGEDGPCEVFVNVGKAGSAVGAMSEAIGRLCSLVLRLPDGLSAEQRTMEIVAQLVDVGGITPQGMGAASIPDAVGQALARRLGMWENGKEKEQ